MRRAQVSFDFALSELLELPSFARPDGRGRPSPRVHCSSASFIPFGGPKTHDYSGQALARQKRAARDDKANCTSTLKPHS